MAAAASLQVFGIKPWKRWQIDCFLRPLHPRIHYCRDAAQALRRQARYGGAIAVWAAREPDGFAEAAAAQDAAVLRIEDGFLRSVGLGSNHVGGASLVVDAVGIYFDPRRPSALENLLRDDACDAALLARAAALRQLLVGRGLTKYNVGTGSVEIGGAGRRRVLVPGQVEDDASIRWGAPGVKTNLELLRAARAAEPDAWIVYKPHPDTEAGTRAGRLDDAEALRHADQVVRGVSAAALFQQIDAVHTMTSLLGFEALLRGVAVTTWGQPFYAGWGLTEDRLPPPRRGRPLSLDELVAGALIRYPLYVDPRSGRPCEAEDVARGLAGREASAASQSGAARRIARLCRGLMRSWISTHVHR